MLPRGQHHYDPVKSVIEFKEIDGAFLIEEEPSRRLHYSPTIQQRMAG